MSGAPPDWHGEFKGFDGGDQGTVQDPDERIERKWEGDSSKFSIIQNLRHGTKREQTYGPKFRVMMVGYNKEGTKLCTASEDKSCRIFDRVTGKQDLRIMHNDLVRYSAMSHGGDKVCTACDDMYARIYDIQEGSETRGQSIKEFSHSNWVNSIEWGSNDELLLTASRDRTVRIYDLTVEEEKEAKDDDDEGFAVIGEKEVDTRLVPIKWKLSDPVTYATFNNDGSNIAVSCGAQRFFGAAHVYDTFRGEADFGGNQLAPPLHSLPHPDMVTTANYSRKGDLLCTSCLDGHARMYDTKNFDQIGIWRHDNWVKSAFFSGCGKYICTSSDDGAVRILDVGTRKQLHKFESGEPLAWAKFAPGDLEVICAGLESNIQIWGIEGRVNGAMKEHIKLCEAAAEEAEQARLAKRAAEKAMLEVG